MAVGTKVKQAITSWLTGKVLFECEVDEDERFKVKVALELGAKQSVDFAYARLVGASLDGASLVGASLVGASLAYARLVGASLDGARLDGASLVGASLDGASLVGARLDGARLVGASLDGARLDGANFDKNQKFIAGGARSDGWYFHLTNFGDEGWRIKAGCRNLTLAKARKHWQDTRGGTPLGDETMLILDHMERLAALRGWDLSEAKSEVAESK